MVCSVSYYVTFSDFVLIIPRCMARSNHLDDDDDALLRTREHAEALLESMTSAQLLWDGYGFIAELKVRLLIVLPMDCGALISIT